MKQRGRKSAASLSVVRPGSTSTPRPLPPDSLDKASAALWQTIVNAYPTDYFAPGDLPLLREYCSTSEVFLPAANSAAERGGSREIADRIALVKLLATLAGKLRLNVSSRSRPDAASITRAHKGGAQGIDELARVLKND